MIRNRALDRAQGGLGIGLTVARRLVELHGGRIEAHSKGLGKGAEFVVTMPALPFDFVPPQFLAAHPILVPSRIRPAPRGGGKVLTAPPPAAPERRAAPRINPRPRWHIGC